MERITEKMLQRKVDYLNRITKNPDTYMRGTGADRVINIGHYHLSFAYGGVALEQTMNEGGGVYSTFNCGHVPKRELFNRICAFIDGIELH